ncbi:hypothetical protein ABZ532_27195 [Streptomyces sp. NPDC019396]|uniref:hypothetical protein n=1 Tax=Streptomyces sp. NPDC019396 TaxID=3154687 RepID=UPI0033EA903F
MTNNLDALLTALYVKIDDEIGGQARFCGQRGEPLTPVRHPCIHLILIDLRQRKKLRSMAEADDWARAEATPSDAEITRIRRLIQRVTEDIDLLTEDERAEVQRAAFLSAMTARLRRRGWDGMVSGTSASMAAGLGMHLPRSDVPRPDRDGTQPLDHPLEAGPPGIRHRLRRTPHPATESDPQHQPSYTESLALTRFP